MNEITCHELIDFLSDYLDMTLPRETVSTFDAHLAVCPDCVAYLDNFRATVQATKAAYPPDEVIANMPEDLVQAILASRNL